MKIKLIDFGVPEHQRPYRPHGNDAGADVYLPYDCTLQPGEIAKIPLGFGLEIPDGYSMLNFVNDTESEVRLDYLKQFCMTDNDIELIAPLPENQNYIDFMFEIASHGKNEEILMAVLPCMLSYSYIFRKLAAVPTSRQSRYWDFIKDYADEQYAESCKEWSAFAEHKCAGLSVANKKYLADIFEKASLLELAFWKMAYRNERMEENAK